MSTAAEHRLVISVPVEAARSASGDPAYSAAEHRTLLKISASGLCCCWLLFYKGAGRTLPHVYIFPLSARLFRDNALACRTFIFYSEAGRVSPPSFLSTSQSRSRHRCRSKQHVRCSYRNRSRNPTDSTCRPGSP